MKLLRFTVLFRLTYMVQGMEFWLTHLDIETFYLSGLIYFFTVEKVKKNLNKLKPLINDIERNIVTCRFDIYFKLLILNSVIQEGILHQNGHRSSYKSPQLYTAYAICVISKHPYYNTLKDCLSRYGLESRFKTLFTCTGEKKKIFGRQMRIYCITTGLSAVLDGHWYIINCILPSCCI